MRYARRYLDEAEAIQWSHSRVPSTVHERQTAPSPLTNGSAPRPSSRVAGIKRRLLENARQVDVERARFTTESYRATEGEPMPMRRAKMLLHLARSLSIDIHPDEIIVGNRSLLPRMGVIAPEGAVDWVDKELEVSAHAPPGHV